ncbi:protein-export chaperone SecB [Taklimakanibacter deserti]|uniref:protein-export chaperone SecB n=1 Tax=Taklimakanibacter deserti TaxID=2267839 RepID=UPI000E65446F
MAKTSKPAPKKQAAKSTNGDGSDSNGPGPGPGPEATAAPAESVGSELNAPPPQPGAQPSMRILGQYLKDLSFENPHAPQSLAPQKAQPEINISINVNARNLAPSDFEVELHIDAKATSENKVIFAAEILYAGVFRLENFPQNMLHPAVLIECPRMLFPFARQILGEATRNGGFPPLMLDPIDFAGMYQKRMAAQAQATA